MQDDKNFMAKAKQENQVIDFQHIKILLTGSAAVGKTSFCRLLFGSKFLNNYESTEIMEAKQAISIMSFTMLEQKSRQKHKEVVWLKLDPKNQRAHFKSLLKCRMFHENKVEINQETLTLDEDMSTPDNIISAKLNTSKSVKTYTNDRSTVIDTSSDTSENMDTNTDTSEKIDTNTNDTSENMDTNTDTSKRIDAIINDISENIDLRAAYFTKHEPQTDVENNILSNDPLDEDFMINKSEAVKLITVIDTGGQPEYIHMLPTINNCPTVNFVVHDMTKELDDPVIVQYKSKHNKNFADYPLHYSNLDMIGLLMSLTTDSLEQPTKQTPTKTRLSIPNNCYIGFIGTHKDKLEEKCRADKIATINERLTCLVNERNCKFAVMPAENGIVFPVDNTTAGAGDKEDPVVKELRQKVEKFINELIASNVTKNHLPITWMILELELQELHEDGGTRYITCEEYTTIATQKAAMMPEEIEESLQHFDFLGVFLHFKQVLGLCDYVIIDHQWLFDSLAMIMHLSPDDINFQDHHFKERFRKRRLLAKSELCIVNWNNNLHPEYFFNLLIYLKVIATIVLNEAEYYYMPCVLSSTIQYQDKYIFLYSAPLLVQFSSGFLPRGFFCSLVVHLLQNLPTGWDHQLHNSEHFSNVITFRLPDKSFLRLHDKTSYLEIQVRHHTRDLCISYHSKIFPVLSQYFDNVCSKLNFNHKKLQYGFLCHDGKSNDDHIAVIKPFEFPLPSELECCRKCPHPTKLGEFHKIWFEEVSYEICI